MSALAARRADRGASFWRAYWITLRPYLFFVSGVSGLAGLAIPSAMPLEGLVLGFAAFFFSYGLGQALTDVSQIDTDSISAPYRPLVRGEISRSAVLGVSLGGLALCATAFFVLSPKTLLLSLAGVLGLASYTPLKRRWWGGPLWNSWIVALLPPIGFLCGEPSFHRAAGDPVLPWVTASVFSSYAVFVLLGYLKDVSADGATGYRTFPVRFGRRATVLASACFAAGALVCSTAVFLRAGAHQPVLGAALAFAGALWLVLAHLRTLHTTRDDEAHAGIACAVRGFVALHAGEAVWLRPELGWLALALVVSFEAALALRPDRRQI